MNPLDYQNYLDELTSTLGADPSVLGLIALGSTADAAGRDAWSDHDFWIITAPGAQPSYLDTFSWLPRADQILMTVRHGLSYRGVLYENRHHAEYAVFDAGEAVRGKIERFRVLIDRGGIVRLAESVRLRTHEERSAALARPDKLENLCVMLWNACERWQRGERLSSQRYVLFSVDALLDLLTAHGRLKKSHAADELDARRRLERREPELAERLSRAARLDPASAGAALLDLAETELRASAPELAWDRVALVRGWLREAGEAA